ncbi:MAG: HEAT repeat domain-containing protein [Myxococcales bacterium]
MGAAEEIGRSGRGDAVERLLPMLGDDSVLLAAGAARGLGAARDKRAVSALMGVFKENLPVLREAAADSLGLLGDPSALPVLEKTALEGGSGSTQAINAIGQLAFAPEGRASLCKLASEGNLDVARLSARLAKPRGGCSTDPIVARLARSSAEPFAALAALEGLGGSAGVEKVVALLDSPDRAIRIAATKTLGAMEAPEAAGAKVVRLLEAEAERLAGAQAKWVTEKLSSRPPEPERRKKRDDADDPVSRHEREKTQKFNDMMAKVDALNEQRAQALGVKLVDRETPAEIDLVDDLAAGDGDLMFALALTAGRLKVPAALPILEKLAKDPHATTRAAACEALGAVGTQPALDLVGRCIEDADRGVLRAAARGLRRAGPTGGKLLIAALKRRSSERWEFVQAIGELKVKEAAPKVAEPWAPAAPRPWRPRWRWASWATPPTPRSWSNSSRTTPTPRAWRSSRRSRSWRTPRSRRCWSRSSSTSGPRSGPSLRAPWPSWTARPPAPCSRRCGSTTTPRSVARWRRPWAPPLPKRRERAKAMPDVRELKDQASKLFTKGKFEKAAKAYEELCKLEPKDMQIRVRLGDALVKAGEKPAAVAAYRIAAESYAKEGFLPRAIAVCKLILEVDPSHSDTQGVLAQLYARKSGGAPPPPAKKPVAGAAGAAAVAAAMAAPAQPTPGPARPAAIIPPAPPRSDDEHLELDTARSYRDGVRASEAPEAGPQALAPQARDVDTSGLEPRRRVAAGQLEGRPGHGAGADACPAHCAARASSASIARQTRRTSGACPEGAVGDRVHRDRAGGAGARRRSSDLRSAPRGQAAARPRRRQVRGDGDRVHRDRAGPRRHRRGPRPRDRPFGPDEAASTSSSGGQAGDLGAATVGAQADGPAAFGRRQAAAARGEAPGDRAAATRPQADRAAGVGAAAAHRPAAQAAQAAQAARASQASQACGDGRGPALHRGRQRPGRAAQGAGLAGRDGAGRARVAGVRARQASDAGGRRREGGDASGRGQVDGARRRGRGEPRGRARVRDGSGGARAAGPQASGWGGVDGRARGHSRGPGADEAPDPGRDADPGGPRHQLGRRGRGDRDSSRSRSTNRRRPAACRRSRCSRTSRARRSSSWLRSASCAAASRGTSSSSRAPRACRSSW